MNCKKCGQEMEENTKVCSSCGFDMGSELDSKSETKSESKSDSVIGAKKNKNSLVVIISVAAAFVVLIGIFLYMVTFGGYDRIRVSRLCNLGNRYLSELDFEQAVASYQAAIEIDPKAEDAYIGLADAYIGLGDYGSAVETLKTGIKETESERLIEYLAEIHLDHTWIEATCIEPKHCSVCGETDGTTEHVWLEATCATPKTCSVCGETEGEALGHIWVEGRCMVCDEISSYESNTEVTETESSSEDEEDVATEEIVEAAEEVIEEVAEEVTNQSVGSEWNPAEDFRYEYDEELRGIRIIRYIGKSTVVHIPAEIDGVSVKSIGDYVGGNYAGVFEGRSDITEVTIPDSVTVIGESAFDRCTGLAKITIPDSVAEIGEWAFHSCTGFTKIIIPGSVTEIGENAFDYCTALTEVTILDGVTVIGAGAFYGCSSLTELIIPNSVTEIEYEAFGHCASLTELIIPNSVTVIGDHAFTYCTGLTEVTMPDSCADRSEFLGRAVFLGCPNFTVIYQGQQYTIDDFYDHARK